MDERLVNIDDARDIQGSLDGDGEAYGRLVRRYQDRITGYLWRFTRDRAVCEELLQEVFVQAYFSLPGFKGQSPFAHWLQRIATRTGYRYWKQQRIHRSREAAPPPGWDNVASRASEDMAPQEAAEFLHALLGQLPPADRLVLTLMHLEERSVAEIADLTGWTKTLVKVRAFRARAKLRKLAERQECRT